VVVGPKTNRPGSVDCCAHNRQHMSGGGGDQQARLGFCSVAHKSNLQRVFARDEKRCANALGHTKTSMSNLLSGRERRVGSLFSDLSQTHNKDMMPHYTRADITLDCCSCYTRTLPTRTYTARTRCLPALSLDLLLHAVVFAAVWCGWVRLRDGGAKAEISPTTGFPTWQWS
jgi:hypothetical protein